MLERNRADETLRANEFPEARDSGSSVGKEVGRPEEGLQPELCKILNLVDTSSKYFV